ncbi:MAG TPA: hypothetical protein VD993_00770 [Chitinophagaceae bacterium]|nr:hypothetical protein [Chitinophagaceae bacterium]
MGLTVTNSSFNYEQRDSKYSIFLDDVIGGQLYSVKSVAAKDNKIVLRLKGSHNIRLQNFEYYDDAWGLSPARLQ